ncbi:hypothetical protein ABEB36_013650 [Hypothenemus hampei]|uniref:THAP-type domain-containing protein n=1 Tax=Hypothenemus hampei TaxID=57062 RepID=A0ABD1E4U8_HYPHA
MMNYCCAINCKNNSRDSKDVSFFTLPKNGIRQLQWPDKIGRLDLMQNKKETICKKLVCGVHFELSMFAGIVPNKTKLKNNAIPTLFQEGVGYRAIAVVASTSTSKTFTVEPFNNEEKKKFAKYCEEPSMGQFINFCKQKLNPGLANLIILQVQLASKKPKGYSNTFKQFALTVYFLGPKIYRFLRKTFQLPHKPTLCRMTANWHLHSGINRKIFKVIDTKMQNLDRKFRDCVLCVDGTSLKTHLF